MRQRGGFGVLLAWLAVAAWTLLVVGVFASDEFSKLATASFVRAAIHWLLPDLDAPTVVKLHFFVRKAVHFIEYFILAVLAGLAARRSPGRLAAKALPATLAWVFLVALADEGRQSLSTERSGRIRDVMIDLSGGLAATGGWILLKRGGRRRGEET